MKVVQKEIAKTVHVKTVRAVVVIVKQHLKKSNNNAGFSNFILRLALLLIHGYEYSGDLEITCR